MEGTAHRGGSQAIANPQEPGSEWSAALCTECRCQGLAQALRTGVGSSEQGRAEGPVGSQAREVIYLAGKSFGAWQPGFDSGSIPYQPCGAGHNI